MKRFISTKFFLALQKASQNGVNIDAQVLKKDYDEFVMLLLSGSSVFTDKMAYHNTLIYTRVELSGLTRVSGEKCGNLSLEIH